MSKFKVGASYVDNAGNVREIIRIEPAGAFYQFAVYYKAEPDAPGLVDQHGHYFMENSIISNELITLNKIL